MNTTVRRGAVVGLLVLSVGCGSGPTSPSRTSQPPSVPTPRAPLITFPPLSGPSRTFVFDGELTDLLRSAPRFGLVRDFTRNSRFVLYDNGAALLQYLPSRFGDGLYRGAYQDTNDVIKFLFEFQGRSIDSPWDDATGTLKGDSLTIQYHEGMQHSDFEDAVYVLTP